MVQELIHQLLEAGVHFGHQTHRWNPKMKRYIFGQRNNIYIIDLEKTADLLTQARDVVRSIAARGGKILFVGTKKQAQATISTEAKRVGMFYISNRWLGGLLTNFQTVKASINRLNEIDKMEETGVLGNLTKKETAQINKERDKLLHNLGGIREMKELPDAVVIIDPKREDIAVKEAIKLGVPIIAMVDTNCDPEPIEYPIPGNDDAIKSIRFIVSLLCDSIQQGREEFFTSEVKEEQPAEEGAEQGQEDASAQAEAEESAVGDNQPAGETK